MHANTGMELFTSHLPNDKDNKRYGKDSMYKKEVRDADMWMALAESFSQFTDAMKMIEKM